MPVKKKVEEKAAVKTAPKAKAAAVKLAPRAKAASKAKRVGAAVCVSCAVAPEDKAFWVNNGPIVSTLEGLKDALSIMSDEQFSYHTSRAGNDFAKWVDEVLCHNACAKKLAGARTREGAVRAIAVCACA